MQVTRLIPDMFLVACGVVWASLEATDGRVIAHSNIMLAGIMPRECTSFDAPA